MADNQAPSPVTNKTGFWNAIIQRLKLPNAQPISSTAQYNFDQIDPNQEGAGHAKFTHNITGAGSNAMQTKRSIAKAQAQLNVTVDPGLRIQIQNGINMLSSQLTRSALGQNSGIGPDRTVPETTSIYRFAGFSDEGTVPASEQNPISSFAAFQLWGTNRQKTTKVQPHRYIKEAGSVPGVNDAEKRSFLSFRNVNNPGGDVFHYGDPPEVATATAPTHVTRGRGRSYHPGRTFHAQDSRGPNGKGKMPSSQISRGFSGQVKRSQAPSTNDGPQ